MLRRIFIGAMAAVLAIGLTMPAATAGRAWRWDECRFQYRDGRAGWTRDEVKVTIRCAAKKFGVSLSTALYVADRESDFRQYARNPYSGACGIYQHIPAYYEGRVRSVPDRYEFMSRSCYNARSNVLAGLHLAKQSGWGPWGL